MIQKANTARIAVNALLKSTTYNLFAKEHIAKTNNFLNIRVLIKINEYIFKATISMLFHSMFYSPELINVLKT